MSDKKINDNTSDSQSLSLSVQDSSAPSSPIMEAYRVLRTNIEFSSSIDKIQVLLITSSLQGEGKSTTVANLARAFAYAGTKTLVLDLDLRRPVQHKFYSLDNTVGVSEIIVGKATCEEAIQTTDTENLHILTSGYRPPNPAELLASPALSELVATLRKSYDMIIMDTPPVNLLADAAILTKEADASILVVSAGNAELDDVKVSLETLRRSGTKLLGTVLNNVTRQSSSYKYRYYYYDY